MWHDISQYDIPNRQLLATNAKPGVGRRRDIGEAKITHTIFGKAKVCIIREQDKKRRMWLLSALAVTALAAAAWQGWVAINSTTAPPLSATVRVSAPAFLPEYFPTAASPSSVGGKPRTLSQTETIATSQKRALQQAIGLKASEQIVMKPVAPQPLIANKPQTTSLVTNSDSSKDQADMQQLRMLSDPLQPAAPIVAIPPAKQPHSQAAVVPLVEPLKRESAPTPSPADDNQPSGPVNVQSN